MRILLKKNPNLKNKVLQKSWMVMKLILKVIETIKKVMRMAKKMRMRVMDKIAQILLPAKKRLI
jgi:hypothetical protein